MRLRTFFLVFLLAELISYAGYFFPEVNAAGFFVIVVAALALSMQRLEYGLYFVLADLILGGKSGGLFSFEYGGFVLSLRMALFIIVMGVWVGKVMNECKIKNVKLKIPFNGALMKWWGVLGIAIAWGLIVGVLRGNNFSDLFLDANGYLYAAMVLPFWWSVMRMDANDRREWLQILTCVFFAATTLLALKTLFTVYLFTHGNNNFIQANLFPYFRWVRNTGVGEITWLPGNFARVFFQSHIYNLGMFFVLLASIVYRRSAGLYVPLSGTPDAPSAKAEVRGRRGAALLVLNTSVILVSFSRSFWVGTIAGLGIFGLMLWSSSQKAAPARALARYSARVIASVLAAVVLLLAVARFPFPRPSGADLGAAAQSRLEAGDAGQSRWNLLPPLTKAAFTHPIVGSGFGTRVTYISNDPRIREVNPTGEYSTTAFEWGWVDLWLKMGILGVIAYVGLLIALAVRLTRGNAPFAVATIAAVAAIHVFTPYLNHPLGLGILILLTILHAGIAKSEAL